MASMFSAPRSSTSSGFVHRLLSFWFKDYRRGHCVPLASQRLWFSYSPSSDRRLSEYLKHSFSNDLKHYLKERSGETPPNTFMPLLSDPLGNLALSILTDQIAPRIVQYNDYLTLSSPSSHSTAFRDIELPTPWALRDDSRMWSTNAFTNNHYSSLDPIERTFFLLPLVHSEAYSSAVTATKYSYLNLHANPGRGALTPPISSSLQQGTDDPDVGPNKRGDYIKATPELFVYRPFLNAVHDYIDRNTKLLSVFHRFPQRDALMGRLNLRTERQNRLIERLYKPNEISLNPVEQMTISSNQENAAEDTRYQYSYPYYSFNYPLSNTDRLLLDELQLQESSRVLYLSEYPFEDQHRFVRKQTLNAQKEAEKEMMEKEIDMETEEDIEELGGKKRVQKTNNKDREGKRAVLSEMLAMEHAADYHKRYLKARHQLTQNGITGEKAHHEACLTASLALPLMHGESALYSQDRHHFKSMRDDLMTQEYTALIEGGYYNLFYLNALAIRGFSLSDLQTNLSNSDNEGSNSRIIDHEQGGVQISLAVPPSGASSRSSSSSSSSSPTPLTDFERNRLLKEVEKEALYCLVAKGDGRVDEIAEKYGIDWEEKRLTPIWGASEVWKGTMMDRIQKEKQARKESMKDDKQAFHQMRNMMQGMR